MIWRRFESFAANHAFRVSPSICNNRPLELARLPPLPRPATPLPLLLVAMTMGT